MKGSIIIYILASLAVLSIILYFVFNSDNKVIETTTPGSQKGTITFNPVPGINYTTTNNEQKSFELGRFQTSLNITEITFSFNDQSTFSNNSTVILTIKDVNNNIYTNQILDFTSSTIILNNLNVRVEPENQVILTIDGDNTRLISPTVSFVYNLLPASTTIKPTTNVPTTQPTTMMPTIEPTTNVPTTQPTTMQPSTMMPTIEPTTMFPTTMQPTTIQPSTMMPTMQPTTIQPSTMQPTTMMPTIQPTTMFPTTIQPSTMIPNTTMMPTMQPTTMMPTTMMPTMQPTTMMPTIQPTTMFPTTIQPSTMMPNTTMEPTTMQPTTMMPTMQPTTMMPTMEPTTMMPTMQPSTPLQPSYQLEVIDGNPIIENNSYIILNKTSDGIISYPTYNYNKFNFYMECIIDKVIGNDFIGVGFNCPSTKSSKVDSILLILNNIIVDPYIQTYTISFPLKLGIYFSNTNIIYYINDETYKRNINLSEYSDECVDINMYFYAFDLSKPVKITDIKFNAIPK